MIFEKYTALNELFNFQSVSDTEWKPISRNANNWSSLYGLDFSGCNIRNRRKDLQSFSAAGCPVQELSDINRWNSGYWAAVLISPKHAIVSSNSSNSNPDQELIFWGRSGTEYRPVVSRRIDFGRDRVVLEFEEDLPEDVTYYKLADIRWVPAGSRVWLYDNQGRILFKIHDQMKQFTVPEPYLIQEWHADPVVGDVCHHFRGDLDTPLFVTDTRTNETYFVGLWISSYPYYEDDDFISDLVALDSRIQIVKPSGVAADINKDGIVNGADLARVLGNFGSLGVTDGDVNLDEVVNSADMGQILASWGEVKPNVTIVEEGEDTGP